MRRALVVAVVLAVSATASGCSTSDLLGRADPTTPPVPTPSGPIPSSQTFGTAFPVAGPDWDATLTLDGLRIVESAVYDDTVLAVDLRAVQASGSPAIDPGLVHAFDPGGREFERIKYPKGTVPDPLVATTLGSPGQEVRGTLAWTMPVGARVGRIDVSTPSSVNSLTVVRQPADPEATSASPTTSASGG